MILILSWRVWNMFWHVSLCFQRPHRYVMLVWNIIFSEFLLFSIHSLCWIEDTKFGRNVRAHKSIFLLESITIVCFQREYLNHFPSIFTILSIFLSKFLYFQILKSLFHHWSRVFNLRKEFRSIWLVHLIAHIHLLPFINHLHFLNLKIPKIFLDFNILTFLHMDSTLTHHYSKFQNKFKELNIICFIREFALSTTIFLGKLVWVKYSRRLGNEMLWNGGWKCRKRCKCGM